MTGFARKFSIELLKNQIEENPWFVDMLRLWRPAGEGAGLRTDQLDELGADKRKLEDDQAGLRLAIRRGYLNFYQAGQSVAKIGFGTNKKLQALIHNKYILGESGQGNGYVKMTSDGFNVPGAAVTRKYNGVADLQERVANTKNQIGEEKSFLDMIVARNPGVIDLEMGLPAFGPERVAPRMDIVALESVGEGLRVVFWEAKLVSDPRARCKDQDKAPEVVKQLKQYEDWLDYSVHAELVASEYQKACHLLVQFHDLAKSINPQIGELGRSIVMAAAPGAGKWTIQIRTLPPRRPCGTELKFRCKLPCSTYRSRSTGVIMPPPTMPDGAWGEQCMSPVSDRPSLASFLRDPNPSVNARKYLRRLECVRLARGVPTFALAARFSCRPAARAARWARRVLTPLPECNKKREQAAPLFGEHVFLVWAVIGRRDRVHDPVHHEVAQPADRMFFASSRLF